MRTKKRILSMLLTVCLIVGMLPQTAFATEGATIGASGLCEHHAAHDETCGYVEGTAETPCAHDHTEDCYEIAKSCTHTHTEDCYPVMDSGVSGNEATPSDAAEPICGHECSEESGCITKESNCTHEHDDTCGYIAAVEGHDCHYECAECAAPVCACETDDPAIHATNCPAYVAPANPECYCWEKCTEDNINIWCDVCGVQGMESCKGEDTATVFDTVTGLTVGNVEITETGTWHVPMDGDSLVKVLDGEQSSSNDLEVSVDESGGYVLYDYGALTSYQQASNGAVDITLTSGNLTLELNGSTDLNGGSINVGGNLTITSHGALTVDTISANGIVTINTNGEDLTVGTLDLSNSPHVVISDGMNSIKITTISNGNGLYRTTADGAFSDTTPPVGGINYFEYISTNHWAATPTPVDADNHKLACQCDSGSGMQAAITEAHGSDFTYSVNTDDNSKHDKKCADCGYSAAEAHDFSSGETCAANCGATAAVKMTTTDITTTYYATLAEAMSAAQEAASSTVTLLKNVTGVSCNVTKGTFTLDLNGYTITGNATSTFVLQIGGVGAYNAVLTIKDSGSNGRIEGSRAAVSVTTNGTVTLESGTLTGNYYGAWMSSSGKLTVTGGTLTGDTYGVYVPNSSNSSPVTISGGTLTGVTADLYLPNNVTVTITGTLSDTISVDKTAPGKFAEGSDAQANVSKFTAADDTNYNVVSESDGLYLKGDLSSGKATVTIDPTENPYTGSAQTPTVTVKWGDTTLTKDTDYTVAWDDTGLTNVKTYTATITGTGNYTGTANTNPTFDVTRANPTYTLPTGLTATYGQTLANVTLPAAENGEWSWTSGDTTDVGAVGTQPHKATFTPNDTSNYNTLTDIAVTVKVGKTDASVTTVPTAINPEYNGNAQSLINAGAAKGGEMQYSLDGTNYSKDIPTGTAAGDYTVYYKVVGDGNHNDTAAQTIPAKISKATASVDMPGEQTIAYGKSLSSISLPSGWKWVNENTIPDSSTGYAAYLEVDDTNYNYEGVDGYDPATHRVTRDIQVTINPTVPAITVQATPASAIARKTITVSATVKNPHNESLTDVPTPSYTYKIGENGTETGFNTGSFVIPENTETGTTILITATTAANDKYAAGTGTAMVIVTDCTHTGNKTLQYDTASHWYTCDDCGAEVDKAAHSGGTATCTETAKCTTCNQPHGDVDSTNHTGSTAWEYDTTHHWGKCACGAELDKETHSGGTATCKDKATCTDCGQPHGELSSSNHAGGTEVRDKAEATTTAEGYTGDTYCLGCNTKIKTGTTIPKKDSGGNTGGGDSGNDDSGGDNGNNTPTDTPATSVTVPVSGDQNSIQVDAAVSGTTATIDHVDLSALNTVIGEDVKTGVVKIDFSVLNVEVDTVEIPADVVKQIAAAANNPNNDAESLEIVLTDGTSIEFDAKALGEKSAQAGGIDITISIKRTTDSVLNTRQQAAVGGRTAFDINVTSGGRHISDMGGKVSVHAPYELRPGEKAEGIKVYYVDDNGNKEACETSYDSAKKRVNWKTNHLSVYMISYEEPQVNPDTGGGEIPKSPETGDNTPAYVTYTVQRGDTLWAIARKYGCTVSDIVAANSDLIKNPDLIYAGWQLKIPQAGATGADNTPDAILPDDRKTGVYIVKQGDTLWAISKKYGCTVAEIVALNGELITDPDLIFAGWELKIPQD